MGVLVYNAINNYKTISGQETKLPSGERFYLKNSYSDRLNYEYYSDGNVKSILSDDGLVAEYYYDKYNRLIEEINYGLKKAYKFTYDAGGNIVKKERFAISGGAVSATAESTDNYVYTATLSAEQNSAWKDQLKSYNGRAIKYNSCGNPIEYLGRTMQWQGDRLTSCDGIGLEYDYNGLRVRKGDKYYLWSGDRLIYEFTDDGKYIYYRYDESGISGIDYNGKNYYFRKNIMGDVLAIYDSVGVLQCRYVYDAWGNHKVYNANGGEITNESHIGNINPIRYRGYYYDKEFGLYYLQSRYYDSSLGRFISPDSFDYLDPNDVCGFNLYAYCLNNPIASVDYSGHSWESFWSGVGDWFKDNWVKLAIGAAVIILGAAVTALTAGTGTGFMAAFGAALLTSAKSVGISMAISAGIGTVVGGITGGLEGALQGFGAGIADGFMWGGIFAGGSQVLSGGFKLLAKAGVSYSKQGFFKMFTPNRLRGAKEIAKIADKGQKFYEYGGTLIKVGKNMLDISNKTFLHLHLWFTGGTHIPIGTILAGVIGGF